MKNIRKYIQIFLFLIIYIYPLKKHWDTATKFYQNAMKAISQPILILRNIEKSDELVGFPPDCLEAIAAFKLKLPLEKNFFLSKKLYEDSLYSQWTIEYLFPIVYEPNARCGFIEAEKKESDEKNIIIGIKGGVKIVCRS